MGEMSACVVWRQTLYKFRSRVKYCEMLPNITSSHSLLCKHSLLLFYLVLCNQLLLNWTKTYQEAKPPECLRRKSRNLPIGQLFFHYQFIMQYILERVYIKLRRSKNHKNLKVLIHLIKFIIFINFGFTDICTSLNNKLLYDLFICSKRIVCGFFLGGGGSGGVFWRGGVLS